MSYHPRPGSYSQRALDYLGADPSREVTAASWAEAISADPNGFYAYIGPLIRFGLVEKFTKNGLQRPSWFRWPSKDFKPPPVVRERPMGNPPPTHAEVMALARNGHGEALPVAVLEQLSKPAQRAIADGASVVPIFRKPDGVDIDRANRIAESIPNETHQRGGEAAYPPIASAHQRKGEGHAEGTRPDPAVPASREAEKADTKFRAALWSDGWLTIWLEDQTVQVPPEHAKTLRLYLCDGVTP